MPHTETSSFDWSNYDIAWLAVDQSSEVAILTTNGSSYAPVKVWDDDWERAVGEAIASLPTSVRRIAEVRILKGIGVLALRDILKLAEQGLHQYDWEWSDEWGQTGGYQRWLLSGTPLKEHELPDTLRNAVVFLPVRFQDASFLGERWLREVGIHVGRR